MGGVTGGKATEDAAAPALEKGSSGSLLVESVPAVDEEAGAAPPPTAASTALLGAAAVDGGEALIGAGKEPDARGYPSPTNPPVATSGADPDETLVVGR